MIIYGDQEILISMFGCNNVRYNSLKKETQEVEKVTTSIYIQLSVSIFKEYFQKSHETIN